MPRQPDDIGDAEALFRDDTPRRPAASRPAPTAAGGDEYDLIGDDPVEDASKAVPVAPVFTPPPAARPKPKATARPRSADDGDDDFGPAAEGARVDRPWSRWGEWGPDLRNLVIAAAVWMFVLYVAGNNGAGLGTLFVLFVAGVGALLVLCYPMAITMERPVRMTPEQAVRDYFAALAHFRPHYRRMWLLLSSAGQDSSAYHDFAGFRVSWQRTLARLREGKAPGRSPLIFQIQDFRSEKSAGKTALNAKFTLSVRAPGDGGAELGSYRMAIGLVRGPDKMWYLNDGALPG